MTPIPELGQLNIGLSCIKGAKEDYRNQDDFAIYLSNELSILGVFDGHGPTGDSLSNFAQETILASILEMKESVGTDGMNQSLCEVFRKCHLEVKQHDSNVNDRSIFDADASGTTATVIIVEQHLITAASVGDSRCILGIESKRGSGKFKCIDLTSDHSADRRDERKRIEAAGGEVRLLKGDIPFRVFVKNQMYPGLAMTRAIGDVCGEEAGVTSEPEIQQYRIDPKLSSFIVLASDGVWEFLSSENVIDIVSNFSPSQSQEAVKAVVDASIERWNDFSPYAVDDITCIIFWLP
jgi:serine/threonine protein phosphatase PrpC